MKYTVVTTFNKKGYDLYGKRMINSFIRNWPSEITLYVYAEGFSVTETAPNLVVRDLNQASPGLVAFKERWKMIRGHRAKMIMTPNVQIEKTERKHLNGMLYVLRIKYMLFLHALMR